MKHNRYKICIITLLASLLCLMTGITQSLHIRVCHHQQGQTEQDSSCPAKQDRSDESKCRVCQILTGDLNSYQPDAAPAYVFYFDGGYRFLPEQQSFIISFVPSAKISRAPPVL
ncbi:MAG: hypothetical protein JXB18_03700 [Sedimentisphaerales bacterium]|nr:hypothetical protein [Sedimentisphaerales bacterium]